MSDVSRSEIAETLRLLHPNDAVELRAFTEAGTWSGIFDDHDALIEGAVGLDAQAVGTYVTIHQLADHVRVTNRARPVGVGETISDEDTSAYRFLPVDLDPIRPPDVPATEDEHRAAEALAEGLWAALTVDRGWPDAVLMGDSGNGAHLLWRIELPTSERPLIKGVLAALAHQFDTDRVRIDPAVCNPSRIWRLYGTSNRKDPEAPGRPHRRSGLHAVVEDTGLVSQEQLEAIAGPEPKALSVPVVPTNVGADSRYGERALTGEIEAVLRATPHDPGRNNVLNTAAYKLGQLVGAGLLDEARVMAALSRAAQVVGLPEREIGPTIRSGLSAGKAHPRVVTPR